MNQQINLYQPILRREAKVFSARAMLLGLMLVALGLLALSAIIEWRLRVQQAEVAQLGVQQQALERRLALMEARFPEPRRDPALEARVAAAEEELQRKRRFLDVFSGESNTMTAGSRVLGGLSAAAMDDLWLTGIRLDAGAGLAVQGLTLNATRLPEWVERLGEQGGLASRRFGGLRVERVNQHALRFELNAAGGAR